MMEVSSQAFDLLYSSLKAYTSYPVNVPVVIVDTTGLSDTFRQDIINICQSNSYKVVCILFDYKDRQDWFKYEGGINHVIRKHVDKMQTKVFKEIKAKDYHKIVRVNNCIDEVSLTYLPNTDNLIVEGNNYTVIGDVHCCVKELKTLIDKTENIPILVGDWIDVKSEDLLVDSIQYNSTIIDFLLDNSHILLVKGNHEDNLFRYINKIKDIPQEDLPAITSEFLEDNKHFNSRALMIVALDYRAKFIELYNRSYTCIKGEGFIVTHAPCKAKYLLKNKDKETNLYYTAENKSDSINNIYNSDYNACWPLHLFGHLTFDKPVTNKHCIGLDTGVGYGGLLTGYDLANKKIIVSTSKLEDKYKNLEAISKFKYPVKELNVELDVDEAKRLKAFIRNKTPYISGTMCPADKTDYVLEDVTTVLDYYRSTGQSKVLIQPKYMGSRAQVLLTPEGTSVYTRNGFKLRETEELNKAIANLELALVHSGFNDWLNTLGLWHNILLDCELMPWGFLGKGLIENEYESYLQANKKHIESFKSYGLYDDLIEAKKKGNTYLQSWTYLDTEQELTSFETELRKYSGNEEPYFQPFNILKVESVDRVLYSNSNFTRFNNKDLLQILPCNLHELDVEDVVGVKAVQELYKELEGIVIKPLVNYEHQAPYIKVRNREYLRLIYGHDYTINLEKLIDKKRINRKLSLSIKEWHLGNELLDIHSSKFVDDNLDYVNNLIRLMFELKKESSLDPRL